MTSRLVQARDEHILFICGHAPTLTADDDKKVEFYDDLDRVLIVVNYRDKIVLLGDFNAKIG